MRILNAAGNKFFGIWQKGACRGEISHNENSGNHKGIYLFRSQGTEITQNNIHDNGDYNIAIADEVTAIKSFEAERSEALKAFPSQFRFGLTGDPVENRADEL